MHAAGLAAEVETRSRRAPRCRVQRLPSRRRRPVARPSRRAGRPSRNYDRPGTAWAALQPLPWARRDERAQPRLMSSPMASRVEPSACFRPRRLREPVRCATTRSHVPAGAAEQLVGRVSRCRDDADAPGAIFQLLGVGLDVDHQAVGLPMRTIAMVVSMFSTILVAVATRARRSVAPGRARRDHRSRSSADGASQQVTN